MVVIQLVRHARAHRSCSDYALLLLVVVVVVVVVAVAVAFVDFGL